MGKGTTQIEVDKITLNQKLLEMYQTLRRVVDRVRAEFPDVGEADDLIRLIELELRKN